MTTIPVWVLWVLVVIAICAIAAVSVWGERLLSRKKGDGSIPATRQGDTPPMASDQSVQQPKEIKEEYDMTMTQTEALKLKDQIAVATKAVNDAAIRMEERNKTVAELKANVAEKERVIGQKSARIVELEAEVAKLKGLGEAMSQVVAVGATALDEASNRLEAASRATV